LNLVDPATADKISQTRLIIGFRNILIHGYDIVENTVVWDIIENNIPICIRRFYLCSKVDKRKKRFYTFPNWTKNYLRKKAKLGIGSAFRKIEVGSS